MLGFIPGPLRNRRLFPDGLPSLLVHLQACVLRRGDDPFKGNAPESAVGCGIAAADIGMHTREPPLLEVLVALLAHRVLPEEPASLIHGNRVPDHLDSWVVRSETIFGRVPDPPHRRDRIPDAQETDWKTAVIVPCRSRKGPAKTV